MTNSLITIVALGMFGIAGGSYAADADEEMETTTEIAAEHAAEEATEGLEEKLEAARVRLEEAAHEVAELSAEVGQPIMERFMSFGEGPRRAIIGVQLDPASGKEGARVKEVSPGGPAADAGIQAKDVIVMVNGTAVKGESTREVARLIRNVKPESNVNVRVMRGGKQRDFVVIARAADFAIPPLPPLPPLSPMGPPEAPEAPEVPGGFMHGFEAGTPFFRAFGGEYADMELATLTPSLGQYFGTNEGILVVRAPKEAGLKLVDGDVILSIDGRKPTSGSHASRILRSYQPGEKVSMKVMRQKKPVSLEVTLPERKGHLPGNRVYRTEEPS